jgi:16S rRNA (uracil1498-N3)-methyltransferase
VYHFFIDESQKEQAKKTGEIEITGADVNHIKNVLRMRIGEKISISDGCNQEYHCGIREIQEDRISCKVLCSEEAYKELPSHIYLFQGLPKGDKMEFIIQKAVELGVYGIIPMKTDRAIVKLDSKKEETKRKRWAAIAESAAKQSGRTVIPEIYPVMNFKEAVKFGKEFEFPLIPYELAEEMGDTKKILSEIKDGVKVGIYIGPEGGFEKEEISYAIEQGCKAITLGKRILRTETAGMALLSILMFQLEK